MLAQLLRRLRSCESVDEIVVATSIASQDDQIEELSLAEGVMVTRGSAVDVLGRIAAAARDSRADVVVRVTADCPLIDPQVVDRVVDGLTTEGEAVDYASNVLRRTFPRGLDVEAMFMDTLVRVERIAKSRAEREHVTVTIRSERPELFLTRSIESENDDSDLRWTVDEAPDLELVRRLYEDLGLGERILPYEAVVNHVRTQPQLAQINARIATWTPHIDRRGGSEEAIR
jgi:spore coat polysaccharide biosynthesis protein SpsF